MFGGDSCDCHNDLKKRVTCKYNREEKRKSEESDTILQI